MSPQAETKSARGRESYRQILRSSSIVGGSSVVQVLLGLVRMKAAALILGLAGVGLIGLFANFIQTAATVAGLGVASAATREIAAERGRSGERETAIREALASATILLGILGSLLVWLFRDPIATQILGQKELGAAVGWLSIGVGLTVVASAQTALLAGLRRMGAIARTNVVGALVATVAGVAAIVVYGPAAILFFVIAAPLANVLAGAWFVARLPRGGAGEQRSARAIAGHWRQLAILGTAIMVGQLLANAGQLGARSLISHRMGLPALGLFQGAWSISMTYLGVILQAMAADYYPRLSETIGDQAAASRVVNEQTEVALLLGGPIILAGLGLAPLALDILYSPAFRPAAELLRWQMLGDVLKIASWPAGYVLLASSRGGTFVALEAVGWAIFLAATWLLLPTARIAAPGIAFLIMYAVYLPLVFLAARKAIGLSWSAEVRRHGLMLAAAAIGVFACATYGSLVGGIAGACAATAFAILAFRKLRARLGGGADRHGASSD